LDHPSKPNKVLNVGDHDLICETLEFYSGDLSENTVAQSDSNVTWSSLIYDCQFFLFWTSGEFFVEKAHFTHAENTFFQDFLQKNHKIVKICQEKPLGNARC
jgi:hypothetical protein